MTSKNNAAPVLDLDDLERELGLALAPKRTTSASDDPLAELARIVGQDSGNGQRMGKGASFDDFITSPPQPVTGQMPAMTPPVEPLFPQGLKAAVAAAASPAPITDPLGALLAQDLGLRSGLDEMPEPLRRPNGAVDQLDDMAAQIAEESDEAAAGQSSGVTDAENVSGSEGFVPEPMLPAAPTEIHAVVAQPEESSHGLDQPTIVDRMSGDTATNDFSFSEIDLSDLDSALVPPATVATMQSPPDPVRTTTEAPGRFDDMVAEFEAAMRDVGGQRMVAASPPSLEPITVPPPPATNMHAPIGPGSSDARPVIPSMSTAAAGAAAGAAALAAGAATVKTARPRRGVMLAGGAIMVAMLGLGGLAISGMGGTRATSASGNAPVIAAKPGVTKERPVNPGGVEVPNQDKEILQPRPQPQQAERIAPREEQPVDLTQAQRQAALEPATPSQPALTNAQSVSGAGVRQIPGVAIVAPVTTTPPAPTPAPVPADAAPRPVASVPITIAGQPPATPAPVSLPPAAAAPGAPPLPQPPQTAASAAPVSPPPVASPQQAAAAEPRRVRAVPIRPDSGEAVPNRAQPQPRVVPAAPRAAEPDASNAPLRITPQAVREASAPAQSAPAQAPRVLPGAVPSSVPSLEADAPTAPAAPTRTASTGGSFTVQLAAEGSEEAARAKFNRMRSQYGSVLGSEQANIRSAEVNGRSVYRVRVGSMSREEAVSMCERLKANGGSCFVARN